MNLDVDIHEDGEREKERERERERRRHGGIRPLLPRGSKIFGFLFFGTSSRNGNIFHQNPAFSWKRVPKKCKMLESSGLCFPKTPKFLFVLAPPQQMATFSTKTLHFPGGALKKQKQKQRFWTLQASASQDSNVFCLFCFFGTSSRNGNIFHQNLAFSCGLFRPLLPHDSKIFDFLGTSSPNGNMFRQSFAFSWRGTKKTKQKQRFWTPQASAFQDSNFFYFLCFWYLLEKWQHFPQKPCVFLEWYPKNARCWTLQASASPKFQHL